jgi:hypothetical protein
MKTIRKLFLLFVLTWFGVQQVFAQAVPVSNMQNAVSGVIQAKMSARGFAANDPRYLATLQSSGSSLAGAAAAAAVVTAAGVTAPAWVTAAVTVGLGALLSYGINLAIDGIKWLINGDGSVTYTPPSSGSAAPPDAGGAMVAGGAYFQAGDVYGGSGANVAKEYVTINFPGKSFVAGFVSDSGAYIYYIDDPQSQDGHCGPYPHCRQEQVNKQSSGAPGDCGAGMVWQSSCRALTGVGGASSPVTASVSQAVNDLSASDKAKPVNPQLVAAIADNAWKNAAAQPGYAGLPYQATDPITSSDAQAWQASHPSNWPTVGDATSPQAAPSGGSAASPFSLPQAAAPVSSTDPSTAPSTGTNPSTQPLSNLGTDPGIGAPALEATPTAQMILSPVLGLMPSLRNFVVPGHQSTCPTPSIDLYGKHLMLDGHCNLVESVRPTLYTVMAFVWLGLALFIILAA